MQSNFEGVSLWKRTLETRLSQDPHSKERDKLRIAFLSMRDRVSPLVAQAHQDCEGLTVHDVTHLDALWEMADLIIGHTYEVTPIEAFIFGCALLIHDAGMAVASFPGGLEAIKKTVTWRDTVASFLRLEGTSVTEAWLENPPAKILPMATFATLRALHAQVAEDLAVRDWDIPGVGSSIHLLDDADLRAFYGVRIGRIAHSHHWSIDEVGRKLETKVGAHPAFPSEWTLNEVKVACMLRCADAAHMDQRRAPTMLLALKQPTGLSRDHWGFQNKLGRPTLADNEIVYSSGQDFGRIEASQWWLCYDTAKMIDREVRNSNALLLERTVAPFYVKGVRGVDSARLFARDVIPSGWEPIDAEVKVSDPIHLARTLGGQNLYGQNELAPIRELIQNAVDAVRARRKQRKADISFGMIRILLEKKKADEIWLHVDDNGVGMSERVLTGPLIDFGKSIWSSSLLKEEYPGVEAAGIRPIGKFGIGFFSIFLLGEDVRVTSKKFDAGVADIRVLEFDTLSRRPLLRRGSADELPDDYSTRVSVKLSNPAFIYPIADKKSFTRISTNETRDISARLKRLISATDIKVEFRDGLGDRSFTHLPNWETVAPEIFLGELFAPLTEKIRTRLIQTYSSSLSAVQKEDSDSFGRASLNFGVERADFSVGFVSIGGLVHDYMEGYGSSSLGQDHYFVGAISGNTADAARKGVEPEVPVEVVQVWASTRVKQLDRTRFTIDQLIPIAQMVQSLGGDPGRLPFCFLSGRFSTIGDVKDFLRSHSHFHILAKEDYRDEAVWSSLSDIGTVNLTGQMKDGVFVIPPFSEATSFRDIFPHGEGAHAFKSSPLSMTGQEPGFQDITISNFMDLVRSEWRSYNLTFESIQIFEGSYFLEPARRWVVTASKI